MKIQDLFIKNLFEILSGFLHFLTFSKSQTQTQKFLLRDENFFSSNMANVLSKNPYFHTDFKNVNFIFVKLHPEKDFAKNCSFLVPENSFFGQIFFGCTFY
jgi:hypothetical protein